MKPYSTNNVVVLLNIYKVKERSFKRSSESETIKTEVVCPDDTNPMSLLKGGRLVEWMDMAAAVCAQTHAEKICLTASIWKISFYHSAKSGDIITIKANITRAFTTSMEILVQAYAREVAGDKNHLISDGYFTCVAISDEGKTSPVVAVKPFSKIEKIHYAAALRRKKKPAKRKIKIKRLAKW